MKTKKLFIAIALIGLLGATATSCKKGKLLSDMEGNYIGSGTSSTGTPFVNQVIKLTKVNNKSVKIEPVGHTYITAFEVDIMRVGTKITSKEGDGFSVETANAPFVIAFSNEPEETFGGTKQ